MTPVTRVLLLGADYYGTLAAARCYGRHGIDVVVADDNRLARTRYSRYVSARLTCPPVSEPDALVAWLERWGAAHPGTLLYPTNDHLAWIFAAFRERLGAVFTMLSPSEDAVMTLLDKKRLHEACARPDVAIDTPRTIEPDEAGADALAGHGPMLLKPRTQVLLASGVKGVPVRDRASLEAALGRFRALVKFDPAMASRYPEIARPLLQEYMAAAETGIFSVSGFVAPDGRIVARAAMKVLQRPRKMGIGLCFEGRAPEPRLVQKIAALCRAVGYYGAFEAEFIAAGDRRLLIDFNPRYFSQMGFDIARGLAQPMLVLHAAAGDRRRLAEAMAVARMWQPAGGEAYVHKGMLRVLLAMQRLSRRMSADEVRRWRRWYRDRKGKIVDAVRDAEDRAPAIVDAVLWARAFARHPRSFIRQFVLNAHDGASGPAAPARRRDVRPRGVRALRATGSSWGR